MKKITFFVITLVSVFGLCILYYYYPRKVSFELAEELEIPYPEFDRSYFIGFDYVEDAERFKYYMVDYYFKKSCIDAGLKGYSLLFSDSLANRLDFTKYDYIITYQKQLKALRHSPHLTRTWDSFDWLERTPLIPTWDSVLTNKVYIYRIKKNNKFRAFGP